MFAATLEALGDGGKTPRARDGNEKLVVTKKTKHTKNINMKKKYLKGMRNVCMCVCLLRGNKIIEHFSQAKT